MSNRILTPFEVDSDNDNIVELEVKSDKELYLKNSQVQAATALAGSALILDDAVTGKLKFKTSLDKSAAIDDLISSGSLGVTPVGDNTEYYYASADGDTLNQLPSNSIVVRDNISGVWRSAGGTYVQAYSAINNTVLNIDSYANHIVYRLTGAVLFGQITGIAPGKYHGQLLSLVFGGVSEFQYTKLNFNATGVFPSTSSDIIIGGGSYLQLFWDNASSLWRTLSIKEPALFTYVSQTASQALTASATTNLAGYTNVTSNPCTLFNTGTSTYTVPATGLYVFEVKQQGSVTLGAAPQGAEFLFQLVIGGQSRHLSSYTLSSRGAGTYAFRLNPGVQKIFLNAGTAVTMRISHIGNGSAISTLTAAPINATNWFKVSRETA